MSPVPSNPWFAATIGLGGLIVGYVVANSLGGGFNLPTISGGNNNPPTINEPAPTISDDPADADDDAFLGDEDATVTMIEFTDYQCPFCSRHFQQTYPQLKADYIDTGKIKYVLRDFPLKSIHPAAQKAAEATECAEEGDQFWGMHDLLFNKQAEWNAAPDPTVVFKQYAQDLGLSAATFDDCLDSGKYADEVNNDLSDGMASGIDATPGFWVVGPDGKGQITTGAYPYDTFKAIIDSML